MFETPKYDSVKEIKEQDELKGIFDQIDQLSNSDEDESDRIFNADELAKEIASSLKSSENFEIKDDLNTAVYKPTHVNVLSKSEMPEASNTIFGKH